jgi:hypothetical protein
VVEPAAASGKKDGHALGLEEQTNATKPICAVGNLLLRRRDALPRVISGLFTVGGAVADLHVL